MSAAVLSSVVVSTAGTFTPSEDRTCSVCGWEAIGVVSHDDRREPWCDRHCADVMAAALIAEPSAQPVVTFYDLDVFRPWSAA